MTNARLQRDAITAMQVCIACLGIGGWWAASALEVTVSDEHAAPVANVAVYALPLDAPTPTSAPAAAVMDQRNRAFVPHILVVQAGAEVHFPNSDSVSHHVYSFSEPYTFELPLYKGSVHPPLRFDTPATIVVGCNIHDDMLGYIHVVDTPFFGTTGPDGRATLDLPAGEYSVRVRTPRLRPEALPPAMRVAVRDGAADTLRVRFAERLFPAHDSSESNLHWHDY